MSRSLPRGVWRGRAKQALCFESWLQRHTPAWWVTWGLAASELSWPWNNSYRGNTKQRGRVPPLANLPKKCSSEVGGETFYKISQQASVQVPLGRWAAAGDGDELCWIAQGSESMSRDWCLLQGLLSASGSLWFGADTLAVVPWAFSYVGSCFYCFGFSWSNWAGGTGGAQRPAWPWRLASSGNGTQRRRRGSGRDTGRVSLGFQSGKADLSIPLASSVHFYFLPKMKTNTYLWMQTNVWSYLLGVSSF